MSNDGLRVYVGERKRSQFVPVENARHIGAGLKQRLAAVIKVLPKPSARTPPEEAKAKNQAAEPPRASAREKTLKERLVDGPAGRLIRLVGGFAN
jgi:hypothetical protein